MSGDLCSGLLSILPSLMKNKENCGGLTPIPGPESSCLALMGPHWGFLCWLKADVGQTKAKERWERGNERLILAKTHVLRAEKKNNATKTKNVTAQCEENAKQAPQKGFKLKRERENNNKCLMYMKSYIPCSILPLSFKCRRNKKVRSDLVDTITRK